MKSSIVGLCSLLNLPEKVPGERRDIVWPFAKSGELQGRDVESEEKVASELPFVNQLLKVVMRGRNRAKVDSHRSGTAEWLHLMLFNGPKDLSLCGCARGQKSGHCIRYFEPDEWCLQVLRDAGSQSA